MNPRTRLAVFTLCLVALIAIAAIASPRGKMASSESMNDFCACVPTKAALFVKSAIAKAHAKSANLVAVNAAHGR